MKVTVIILFLYLATVHSGRILVVVPTPSFSHQIVFQPLTQELARRGHEVVVITTDPINKNKEKLHNLREIDVHDVSYTLWRRSFMNNTAFGRKSDIYKSVELFLRGFNDVLEVQLKSEQVQRLIRGEEGTFDLLILEASVRPALIFSHVFRAPVIQMSTSGPMLNSNGIVGAPSHIFLYPWVLHQRLYNLTIWEKITELKTHWEVYNMYMNLELEEEKMLMRVMGPGVPSLQELSKNVQMMFYNSYSIWCDNQPVPPNVVYVGGIHIQPEKELPEDLKSYLDSCRNGVIYVSFGNNVKPSLMPKEKIQMLASVFSSLPYNVLWRWDADVPGISANVKTIRWVPQSDLLRHPNIKLFITQGGLQSAEESINAGVPVIGIPMIADQWYNAEKFEYFKIGKKLFLDSSTKDEFKEAILTVAQDKSYRDNVIRLRQLMRDQPISALDRAVWWTEYLLRHGGAKHLQAPAANMPWTEYYDIQFILTLLVIPIIFLAVLVSLVLYLLNLLNRFRNKVKIM